MVRTVFALLALLALSAPVLAEGEAPSTSFSASRACRAGGVPVDLSGCGVSVEGVATLVGCEGNVCTVELDLAAAAVGVPPGSASLQATFAGDARSTVCRADRVGTETSSLACDATATYSFVVPAACRLLLVEASVTANVAVKASTAAEIRVCKVGTIDHL